MQARFQVIAAAALFSPLGGADHARGCGYYGCEFESSSLLLGAALRQLSPADQAFFFRNDGSAIVQQSNALYNNMFGINTIPGGFDGLLAIYDPAISQTLSQGNPRNYLPPVFGQLANPTTCNRPPLLAGVIPC
jgi:hypothetical protein